MLKPISFSANYNDNGEPNHITVYENTVRPIIKGATTEKLIIEQNCEDPAMISITLDNRQFFININCIDFRSGIIEFDIHDEHEAD